MNLFLSDKEQKRQMNQNQSKRQRFREQIRGKSLRLMFGQVRQRLVQGLEASHLGATIQKLAKQFNHNQLQQLLYSLMRNSSNQSFLERIADEKHQDFLVDILLKHQKDLSIEERIDFIGSLNYLTYYSDRSSRAIISRQDFADYLGSVLRKSDLTILEQLKLFKETICLLMNLSSMLDSDFNMYMAQSDICLTVNRQIAKTTNYLNSIQNIQDQYRETIQQTRDMTLRLFANVLCQLNDHGNSSHKIVKDVLRDQQNLKHHRARVFNLLNKGLQIQGFWDKLMATEECMTFLVDIAQDIDQLQQRCFGKDFLDDRNNHLTKQEYEDFHYFVQFMNNLYFEEEQYEICWITMVESTLNGFMLAQFISQSFENKKREQLINGLKTYVYLGRTYQVSAEQLIIVKPADEPLKLLKIFTDSTLLKGSLTGKYCLQILDSLLSKDPTFLGQVMQFRILESISDLLKNNTDCDTLIASIELLTQIMISEKQSERPRLMHILESNGILSQLDKLNDHDERKIYERIQGFYHVAPPLQIL